MAPGVAFSLGCITTVCLFLCYTVLFEKSGYVWSSQPEEDLGAGLKFPIYLKAAVRYGNESMDAYALAFTARAPMAGSDQAELKGRLVRLSGDGDDAGACKPPKTDLTGSVVLVEQGGCKVAAKLLNCHVRGAVGVIVAGDIAAYEAATTLAYTKGFGIPGFVVTKPNFATLNQLAQNATKSGVTVTLWTLPANVDLDLTEILFLLIVRPFLLLAIVGIVVLVNMCSSDANRRAPRKVVTALPTRYWTDDTGFWGRWGQSQCSICLDDFEAGCEVMTLPCGHEFHTGCVSRWLLRQRGVCPLCKQRVSRERVPLLV